MSEAAEEHWLPVVGYEGLYEVSDRGRVRGVDRVDSAGRRWKGRVLRLKSLRAGYRQVDLWRDGKRRARLVHRLVLESFVGPPPSRACCCHCDGDRSNDILSNLRWDTWTGNEADKVAHGTVVRGSACHTSKLAEEAVRKIRADPRPQRVVAVEHGITQAQVSRIKRRESWAWVSEPLTSVSPVSRAT